MIKNILGHISDRISDKITSTRPVTGGSISSAYLLETSNKSLFLKINKAPEAIKMFHAEQKGLDAIERTGTISVPHVHLVDSYDEKAIIMMDYVENRRPDPSDYARLGAELAGLHLIKQKNFGFTSDNFIGSLPQSNQIHSDWIEFYWEERISPQLQLALRNGLLSEKETPGKQDSIDIFNRYLNDVTPSLLHGDLWGGNYLISTNGTPYLIDPAVYRGHSMVDIAMSKLFGSFGTEFYNTYHEIIPKPEYYDEQIDLYQLYFLLVHLNMFGRGYYSSVSNILKRYF
ncbi:MAG: fructosamine kinase family protein [Fermentimonas sp.]|jgi:fructosamine-3-kinase|nr:fructosamine kinase family protein [Fermentimonas sp.]MDD2930688.1 fructosamine kinase family protein [Fermentimonas sp.]MDD3189320.1 fructosamine kinase family protein [Fermentimonas sp.]MDD4724300.1 fructosamine kinase family protein [Fermentimonas sp.]